MRFDPKRDESIVMAGWGSHADWYLNIHAALPEVETGGRRFTAAPRFLSIDEAAAVLADYEQRNARIAPILRAVLSWFAGWNYDASEEARRRIVTQLPFVAFRPVAVGDVPVL